MGVRLSAPATACSPLYPPSKREIDMHNHSIQGCYDIGLPSHKSLFQLQAERLASLQALAAAANGGAGKPLRWFIMTSPFTHADTV